MHVYWKYGYGWKYTFSNRKNYAKQKFWNMRQSGHSWVYKCWTWLKWPRIWGRSSGVNFTNIFKYNFCAHRSQEQKRLMTLLPFLHFGAPLAPKLYVEHWWNWALVTYHSQLIMLIQKTVVKLIFFYFARSRNVEK